MQRDVPRTDLPMRHIPSAFTIALAMLTLFTASAALVLQSNAETIGSSYTSTAPKDCRVKSANNGVDDSTIRICPGKHGLFVRISEDDLRESVSVGRNRLGASREPAAQTWFGPFNSTTNTVEWRAANGRAYAIIQRWHIADNADPDKDGRPVAKPMLAVTRLSPGPVCHVAYVDVQANPDANELARKAADDFARDFRCGKDKVKTVGKSGRAVAPAGR